MGKLEQSLSSSKLASAVGNWNPTQHIRVLLSFPGFWAQLFRKQGNSSTWWKSCLDRSILELLLSLKFEQDILQNEIFLKYIFWSIIAYIKWLGNHDSAEQVEVDNMSKCCCIFAKGKGGQGIMNLWLSDIHRAKECHLFKSYPCVVSERVDFWVLLCLVQICSQLAMC